MSDFNDLPLYDNRDTKPFESDEPTGNAPQRRPHILDNQIPSSIRFVTQDLSNIFSIEVEPVMVIGRRNSIKDKEVAIDLSDFDAYELGVSRFHAMILTLDNRVTIKDLNSLNGTRLNNMDLQPAQEYILEHGDKITFGQLTFMVAFVY